MREEVQRASRSERRIDPDAIYRTGTDEVGRTGADERVDVAGGLAGEIDRAVAGLIPPDARGRIESHRVRAAGAREPGSIEGVGQEGLAVSKPGGFGIERDLDGGRGRDDAAGVEQARRADHAQNGLALSPAAQDLDGLAVGGHGEGQSVSADGEGVGVRSARTCQDRAELEAVRSGVEDD